MGQIENDFKNRDVIKAKNGLQISQIPRNFDRSLTTSCFAPVFSADRSLLFLSFVFFRVLLVYSQRSG